MYHLQAHSGSRIWWEEFLRHHPEHGIPNYHESAGILAVMISSAGISVRGTRAYVWMGRVGKRRWSLADDGMPQEFVVTGSHNSQITSMAALSRRAPVPYARLKTARLQLGKQTALTRLPPFLKCFPVCCLLFCLPASSSPCCLMPLFQTLKALKHPAGHLRLPAAAVRSSSTSATQAR